jgi:hypothetical protein
METQAAVRDAGARGDISEARWPSDESCGPSPRRSQAAQLAPGQSDRANRGLGERRQDVLGGAAAEGVRARAAKRSGPADQ